jgi:hypothetical protein
MDKLSAGAKRWLVAAAATAYRGGFHEGLVQADIVRKHNELYTPHKHQTSLADSLKRLNGLGLFVRVGLDSKSVEGQQGKELKLTVRMRLRAWCGGHALRLTRVCAAQAEGKRQAAQWRAEDLPNNPGWAAAGGAGAAVRVWLTTVRVFGGGSALTEQLAGGGRRRRCARCAAGGSPACCGGSAGGAGGGELGTGHQEGIRPLS